MRHEHFRKYPKRFCVGCNDNKYVYVVPHAKYDMYHCSTCKQEITRAGDGQQGTTIRRVEGGIDVKSFSEDFLGGKAWEIVASESPEVLSDEHSFWPARDEDAEALREDRLRTFKVALTGLTARQAEVLHAVDLYGSQERAAVCLGISQQAVAATLKKIQKKLRRMGCETGTEGEIGKGTL